MKQNLFCLLTGYLNTDLNDGGTVCLLNLLKKLNLDGFNPSLLNLTPRGCRPHKDVLEKSRRGEAEIISESRDSITFYLKDYPFPFAFHFTGVDIKGAYRSCRRKDFNSLLDEWEEILEKEKPTLTFTVEEDIFSMYAALKFSPVRLHRINSVCIFEKNRLSYPEEFRKIIPEFLFVCGGKFLQDKLKKHYGLSSINLPPVVEYDSFSSGKAAGEHITMVNGSWHKGLVIFLHLAKNMPGKKFLLAGGKNLLLEKYNLPNIRSVPGPVRDINEIYDMTRVLIAPSLWEESFGMVIAEAMSRGIPVIANDTGGIRDAMNGAGFLVGINGKRRAEADFYLNIGYHLGALSSYRKHLLFLDNCYNYRQESAKALKAAEAARKNAEAHYAAFKEWVVSLT